jgi:hypothetical protein
MKKSVLFILLFSVFSVNAQTFALIENKGENAKYFDYQNPNSFVGVLVNNLGTIPSMVTANKLQGVYDAKALSAIGVDSSTMLTFSLAQVVKDSIDTTHLTDSFQFFLDSVYWKLPISQFKQYYFDVRNLKAILIEETAGVKWVHLIKSLPNGNSMISLSLTAAQLKESDCLVFWQILSDEQSDKFKLLYMQEMMKEVNNESFISWKGGRDRRFSSLEDTYSLSDHPCHQEQGITEYPRDVFSFFRHDFDTTHTFKSTSTPILDIHEIKFTQNEGTLIYLYDHDVEDYQVVYKTNQSFERYIDSILLKPQYRSEIGINLAVFKSRWEATELNNLLVFEPETIILWKDAPKSKAAVAYLQTPNDASPKITDAITFVDQNAMMLPIVQFKDLNNPDNPVNTFLNAIKIDASIKQNWLIHLNVPTKKIGFSSIQSSLMLINKSSVFYATPPRHIH